MLVLDSSIFASVVVKDEFYEECKELVMLPSATLDLSFAESANVLWKHVHLLGRIAKEEAVKRVELLTALVRSSDVHSSGDFMVKALEIALECGITVYDALFLALAMKLGAKLATTDEGLYNKLKDTKYSKSLLLIGGRSEIE